MVKEHHILMGESWLGAAVPSKGRYDHLYDQTTGFVSMYFGDHFDWAKLHEFNMPELYDSKNIKEESNMIADDLKRDIEQHSVPPIEEFEFNRIFQAPLEVQNIWIQNVAMMSSAALVPLDQINIFFNGGNLTIMEERKMMKGNRHYENHPQYDALGVLMFLSQMENDLDNVFYKQLTMIDQKYHLKMGAMTYLSLAKSQAPCLYDALQSRNSSLSRMFIENVEKEKFVLFVTEITETLEKLVRSEKTIPMVQMFYKSLKSKIKSYDYNSLFSKLYLTFLQTRQLLLKIDIVAELENLNDIHFLLAQTVWKLKTGQSPEIAEFLDNFFRNTYGSREFWVRLDVIYHETIETLRGMYAERQAEFEILLESQMIPFIMKMKSSLEQLAEGDQDLLYNIFEHFDCNLPELIDQLNDRISRQFLSCWAVLHGKPDYAKIKQEMAECPNVKFFKTLIFADWPQEEIFPATFENLAYKLHRTFWLIVSGLFGSCDTMMEV